MFEIDENGTTLHITRGRAGTLQFDLSMPDEELNLTEDDMFTFIVKPKNGFDSQEYVLKKDIKPIDNDSVVLTLTSEDTSIGELINKPVTYWYELSLNGKQNIIGYDKNGAKELILYPVGYPGGE